ncbi:MAG: C69 family dipeptidase [Planctomycetes bacterium]|nr:C69 family dipeptidase [Planctomycetota bacterium]
MTSKCSSIRSLSVVVVCGLVFVIGVLPAYACYTVVVGRDVSVDGSVLVGHNEQNTGKRFINFRKVPRLKYDAGAVVDLRAGGHISQVKETHAFLWSENPGIPFSDSYMNEHGVVVVTDGCPDRGEDLDRLESQGRLRDGGIGYMLRRLVVERAKTARQGVQIAGGIIDEVGYCSSRTLVIADAKEGWLLSMTRGRQWVARRVPDDKVVVLPNVYIINEVNLSDNANFLASENLVDYAVEKGWWPAGKTPFVFSKAYSRPREVFMDPRQWRGQCMVMGAEILREPDRQLPFAVKPAKKLAVKDVIGILRNHKDVAICKDVTQEGLVFQLREYLPPEIGCVYWRTSGEPCTSVLTPWYCGITKTPKEYYKPVGVRKQLTLEHHFSDTPGKFGADSNLAWWVFKKMQDRINARGEEASDANRMLWDSFEAELFTRQPVVEEKALDLYKKDASLAASYLTEYCGRVARKTLAEAAKRQ